MNFEIARLEVKAVLGVLMGKYRIRLFYYQIYGREHLGCELFSPFGFQLGLYSSLEGAYLEIAKRDVYG